MTPRARKYALGVAVASTLAVLTAGCGGDGKSKAADTQTAEKAAAQAPAGGGGKGTTLALAADPGGKLAFDKNALQTRSGKTTIDFANASQVPHAVEVEGPGVEKETKTIQGGKASLQLDLKPGKYKFYCPVANHRDEGMKGVLVVK